MSKGIEKYLKRNTWYHATTLSGWKEICKYKLQIAYNKGNELDFGFGFYLTPKLDQAIRYIETLIRITQENSLKELSSMFSLKENEEDKIGVIVEFNFVPYEWYIDEAVNFKLLNSYDDEFANFVFYNRTENIDGDKQHNFDVIFGVMSDSNPIVDIERFRNGEIGKDEVIESFKKNTSNKQLSIHNQKFCDILKPSKAFIISTGEELNINDYINSKRHEYAR